jgi:glycosyltransferase involved in cell wall biosynthesis
MYYSVVILSYNKLPQIQKTVAALNANQVRELILCDDCSNDGTYEWAKSCGRFNHMWQKETHDKYSLNTLRNKGVELASEPYVVFLDADCVPQANYFEGHDAVFKCFPECISIGFTFPCDERGESILMNDPRLRGGDNPLNSMWWGECFGGNIAFTKSIWENAGKFDEEFNGSWGFEDLDFAYRASLKGTQFYSHRATVARHLRHPPTVHDHYAGKGRNYKLFVQKHGKII